MTLILATANLAYASPNGSGAGGGDFPIPNSENFYARLGLNAELLNDENPNAAAHLDAAILRARDLFSEDPKALALIDDAYRSFLENPGFDLRKVDQLRNLNITQLRRLEGAADDENWRALSAYTLNRLAEFPDWHHKASLQNAFSSAILRLLPELLQSTQKPNVTAVVNIGTLLQGDERNSFWQTVVKHAEKETGWKSAVEFLTSFRAGREITMLTEYVESINRDWPPGLAQTWWTIGYRNYWDMRAREKGLSQHLQRFGFVLANRLPLIPLPEAFTNQLIRFFKIPDTLAWEPKSGAPLGLLIQAKIIAGLDKESDVKLAQNLASDAQASEGDERGVLEIAGRTSRERLSKV